MMNEERIDEVPKNVTPAIRHVYEKKVQATRDEMWALVSVANWPTRRAFYHITQERQEQDKQWGGPEHDDHHNPENWIAYICKHLGRAVIEEPWHIANFRKAMVKVAALAVASIEWCDRIQGRSQ